MPCLVGHPHPQPDCHPCHKEWPDRVPWPPPGTPAARGAAGAPPEPCPYLGEHMGERVCESCRGGRVRIKLYGCSHPVHGPTTWLARCRDCPRLPAASKPRAAGG